MWIYLTKTREDIIKEASLLSDKESFDDTDIAVKKGEQVILYVYPNSDIQKTNLVFVAKEGIKKPVVKFEHLTVDRYKQFFEETNFKCQFPDKIE